MKPSVYLDSSIPSYLFDQRDSLKTYIEFTQAWWLEERDCFEVCRSEETIAELNRGNYPNKSQVLECVAGLKVLACTERVIDLARGYMNHYLMPRNSESEALHLAYASCYKIDFLLTWNYNHLANANKPQHLRILNARLHLAVPDIVTPLPLFKEKIDDS